MNPIAPSVVGERGSHHRKALSVVRQWRRETVFKLDSRGDIGQKITIRKTMKTEFANRTNYTMQNI